MVSWLTYTWITLLHLDRKIGPLFNYMSCYTGDLNETYFVGNVDEESRQLVKCTYECLDKAISIGMIMFIWHNLDE
jgi:methionine aminopeptidase